MGWTALHRRLMPAHKQRQLARFWIAVIALGLVIPAVLVPVREARGINVFGPPNTETYPITIKIEVYGPDRAAKVREWKSYFDKFWGQDFYVGCRKVEFKLDIVQEGRGGPDYHPITVNAVLPGDYHVSSVYMGNFLPTEDNYLGTWSSRAPDEVIAHEMGHLLGLPDEYFKFYDKNGKRYTVPNPNLAPEYTWNDKNGDGKFDLDEVWNDENNDELVDPGELTRPTLKPGQSPSLMSESGGKILPRHIKEVVRKNVPGNQQRCEWKGTIDHGEALTPEGGTIDFSAHGVVAFAEDLDGIVSGEATLTLTYLNASAIDSGRWELEPTEVQFTVTGQRDSADSLQIALTASTALPTSLRGTFPEIGTLTIDNSGFWDYLMDPGFLPPLQRDGEMLVLEERGPDPQGLGEKWTIVTLERVDDGPGVG